MQFSEVDSLSQAKKALERSDAAPVVFMKCPRSLRGTFAAINSIRSAMPSQCAIVVTAWGCGTEIQQVADRADVTLLLKPCTPNALISSAIEAVRLQDAA